MPLARWHFFSSHLANDRDPVIVWPYLDPYFSGLPGRPLYRLHWAAGLDLFRTFQQTFTKVEQVERLHTGETFLSLKKDQRVRARRGFLSGVRHKGELCRHAPVELAGGVAVGKTPDKQIQEIEETQEALQESIDEAKQLAEKAQELLQKHKETIKRETD